MKQVVEILMDFNQVEEPVQKTVLQVKDLEKELLVLRLAFGQLKTAITQAVAPVATVLVPVLTAAVRYATGIIKTIGQVVAGLLGVQVAQTKVTKAVISGAKALKQSLAGFDQLERLQGNERSGGGSTSVQQVPVEVRTTLSPGVQEVVNRIQELFAPLQSLDLLPLRWGFARLQEQAEQFTAVAGETLGMLWNQVLMPFVQWVVEEFAPVLLNLGAGVFKFLGVILGDVSAGFSQMLAALQPLAAFVGDVVLTVFDQLRRILADTRIAAETEGTALGSLFRTIGETVGQLWERVSPVMEQLRIVFAETFRNIGRTVFEIMHYVIGAIEGAVRLIGGVLSNDWAQIWQGMAQVCKDAVNGIIGVLNVLLAGLTGAINGVFKLLNKISVEIPDWVPEMGGETFGFHLKELKTPKIPYLAKGAVLPANKPFLAMVGDQKHGTNIEAPLATIQEAVAAVTQNQTQAILAGFEASVGVQQEILEAVLGISIGDEVIGNAMARYSRKQAVIRGGAL